MSDKKKDLQQFYIDLLTAFEVMGKLPTWSTHKWTIEGYHHAIIMSDIADEVEAWIRNDKLPRVAAIMGFIDKSFYQYDDYTTNYIRTDFLGAVMEFESKYRAIAIGLMAPITLKLYERLAESYE